MHGCSSSTMYTLSSMIWCLHGVTYGFACELYHVYAEEIQEEKEDAECKCKSAKFISGSIPPLQKLSYFIKCSIAISLNTWVS